MDLLWPSAPVLGAFLTALGCREIPVPRSDPAVQLEDQCAGISNELAPDRIRSATTDRGRFLVRWGPAEPLALNEPLKLLAEVLSTSPPNAPLADLDLRVSAWMPAHGHGMLRRPEVSEPLPGHYEIEGVLLHMRGTWDLHFDVVGPRGIRERASFRIDLDQPDRVPLSQPDAHGFTTEEVALILEHSPLPPPPADPTNRWEADPRAAHLGRLFYFTRELSRSRDLSCATCHLPELGFADGEALAQGHRTDRMGRHTPSLWNAAYQRWFFWDGRRDTLWSQALAPLEDPREHDLSRIEVLRRIAAAPVLRGPYEKLFGPLPDLSSEARFPPHARPAFDLLEDGGSAAAAWAGMADADRETVNRAFANVGKAIAAHVRRLVSRRAPFDVFVEGLREGDETKLAVLSAEARRGLKLFVGRAQCHLCHAGPTFSDLEFHDNLVPRRGSDPGRWAGIDAVRRDPFNAEGAYSDAPAGSRQPLDQLVKTRQAFGEFKTPTLRNVALTPPYMHQGQLASLGDVVDYYATLRGSQPGHHPLGIPRPFELGPGDREALVRFLESLTDTALDPEHATALMEAPPEVLQAEGR